ncbi:MAG: S-layer homology domain-containing protein [Oscillibacter sp.]|nr:S-layer homology domain-containing protein [Oscillibacter sp.]
MKMNGTHAGRVGTRLLSAMLSLVMALSLLPGAIVPVSAASWMEPYLEKLVSWGVMRGDSSGDLHPDRTLTRGEFVVLVNRAFGYDDTSASVPFRDVKAADWYYDDINIGYTTGYFNGTSKSTASPKNSVTREQAAVLLGRNLALDDDPGASLDFTDSNTLSNYSRGLIRSSVVEGILSGYGDGSFKPKQSITRGQMAVLLVNAIGTPVNKSGTQTLGGVYGNVTISTSGVTLKDTTIAGNLYITGGLGLGDVTLENVNVLGKIVVCGAGESEKGKNSVILRGVTAPTLIMDNLANNVVSVRAEGSTKIDNTSIRTPSYVEDATEDNYGFTSIKVEGEEGTTLSAAGNLKEIVTVSPKSTVTMAKGSVKSLTVDEAAAGSTVSVLSGAAVKTLNLDTGTTVTGKGDVDQMNVNTAGTKAEMLPDTIVVRPGIDATINGQKMDTTLAAESSADPRLLAGYPKITDLAPVSAKGLMRTNKSGTLYWALTSVTDGSVGEADLLKPANNANIVKSGNMKAAASNTDYSAAVSGLTSDGSYYFSAMLVDARDQRSPVKTVSFSTPDNTTPNFASGYPYMSKITSNSGDVTVMPTKTCRLYYALLPKNATAPTDKDFKANAVSGNLGFGSRDVTKNVSDTFRINRNALDELGSYDLYLWLTDVDGAHSSAVKKVSFTTIDGTPPKFVSGPTVNSIKETSVGIAATLDEVGTIYWVAVKEGEEYPKPMNGQTTKPELTSDAAKLQVANGMNALKSGKVSATANKDTAISITGLTSETAYDVYYVAQDKAGNYSAAVGKMTIHTLDINPPTITQEFTRTNDTAGTSPRADTDINIVFSESVQDTNNQQLLALYQKSKDTTLTQAERDSFSDVLTGILSDDIQLWSADVTPAARVVARTSDSVTNWVIDYRHAIVTAKDGKIIVTFTAGTALNLKSGAKYYFKIQDIADTSTNKNIIKPNPTTLSTFTTVFAQIQFSSTDTSAQVGGTNVDFDMSFRAVPISTGNAGDGVYWDLLFRMNIPAKFELYEKVGDSGVWEKCAGKTTSGDSITEAEINSTDGTQYGASYTRNFVTGNTSSSTNAELLKNMTSTRYYGIRFTSINNVAARETWSGKVEMQVQAVAGSSLSALHNLAVSPMQDSDLTEAVGDGLVQVGSPAPYTMKHTFSDTMVPDFVPGYPKIVPSDLSGTINVQLTRTTGKIFYVIAPVGTITTTLTEPLPINPVTDPPTTSTSLTTSNWDSLPTTTTGVASDAVLSSVPSSGSIMTPPYTDTSIIKGSVSYYGSNVAISLKGLSPKTQYVAYFVLQGSSSTVYSVNPYVFKFLTSEVSRPIITLEIYNPKVSVSVNTTSDVDYLLAVNGKEPPYVKKPMTEFIDTTNSETNALFTTGGAYANYTALDAMCEDYKENNVVKGSLFDQYATEDAKLKLAANIRAQTASGDSSVAAKGRLSVDANSTQFVDCSPFMSDDGGYYTFLSVGMSSAGSGNAFRAIYPLFKVAGEAPKVTTCGFDGTVSDTGLCTGVLTVGFDRALYYRLQENGKQINLPLRNVGTVDTTNTYQCVADTFTPGVGYDLKDTSNSNSNKDVQIVRYDLSNARNGSTLIADSNLCDQNGHTRSPNLTITLNVSAGDTSPTFTVSSGWDGR